MAESEDAENTENPKSEENDEFVSLDALNLEDDSSGDDVDSTQKEEEVVSASSEGDEAEAPEVEAIQEEKQLGRFSHFKEKVTPIFSYFLRPYHFCIKQLRKVGSLSQYGKELIKRILDEFKGEKKQAHIERIKLFLQKMKQPLVAFFQATRKLSRRGKVLFLGSTLIFIALIVFIEPIMEASFLPDLDRQALNSFEEVASGSFAVRKEDGFEGFDSSLRHPEYVVLLKRVVVNLRRAFKSRKNPMALFEFYLEASTQEAAVELREREVEFLDRLQRTIETMTYRELNTEIGKQRMKVAIRRDLNQVITKGRIKRVLIKTMTLKP